MQQGKRKLESKSTIELENVLVTKNNIEELWLCTVSFNQIYDWIETGKLSYYMGIDCVKRKISDAIDICKNKSDQYVEEIKELMLNYEFYANNITFNFASNTDSKLLYNSTKRTLVIDTQMFEMVVIEGLYSCLAVLKAIKERNDLDGIFCLSIMNISVSGVKSYLCQQAKRNLINKDYWEKYNPNNRITKLITNINYCGNESINALYKKIDLDFNTPNTFIPFEMFRDGLDWSGFTKKINNATSEIELNKIKNYIVEFYDAFYKTVEKNKINANRKKILFYDSTFIMRLLITCNRYYETNCIDEKAMHEAVNRLRRTTTKFTTDYPIDSGENNLMNRKFKRLLGKIIVKSNTSSTLPTIFLKKPKIRKFDTNSNNNYFFRYKGFNVGSEIKTEMISLIKQRIGQNKLRDYILDIYGHKCALCDIDKDDLLKCSHITRWRDDEKNRLNPKNAICFCNHHDGLFDKGYFSLDENYEIIYGFKADDKIVHLLKGKKFREPLKDSPDKELLNIHFNSYCR